MSSDALTYPWLLWRQHRWGIVAIAGYLLLASALVPLLPSIQAGSGIFSVLALPLYVLPFYILVVFAYGRDIDELSSRESCFPARLFRLPVRTEMLVRWPLAYGSATAVALWFLIAFFMFQPMVKSWGDSAGAQVPLWWPGFLIAATLAWAQAILWSPFGLAWFRVGLLCALLPAMIGGAIAATKSGAAEVVLVAVFASSTGLAWTIAFVGVKQARRGVVPDWDWLLEPARVLGAWLPQRRMPFTSANHAQTSLEWRQVGKPFPIIVALVLPCFLWLLLFSPIDKEATVAAVLYSALVPVFIAGIARVRRRPEMMPFLATLPMHTSELVAATLRAATISVLGAWTVVALLVPLAVVVTGNLDQVSGWYIHASAKLSAPRVAVGSIAGIVLLVTLTWKRKVDRLCVAFTGRMWIEATLGWLCIAGYLVPLCILLGSLDVMRIPVFLGSLIAFVFLCRLLATIWALHWVLEERLLERATVMRWIAGWLLLTSILLLALVWATPTEILPTYDVIAVVLFAMPMARLAATPLALSWNRHR